MNDGLDLLWASFDSEDPIWGVETIAALPDARVEQLVELQIARHAANASHVACPDCPDRHVEEVSSHIYPDGRSRFFISCPASLRVEIDPDLLVQWMPDFGILARRVKELLRAEGRVSERVSNHLWRLGTVNCRQQSREVFMARGLNRADRWQISGNFNAQNRPIVFIGMVPPPPLFWPQETPAVIPLPSVVSIDGANLQLDASLLDQMIHEADEASKQSAAAADKALKFRVDQLIEARFFEGPVAEQIAVRVREGKSTRQIADDLTKRSIPMHHSTVARRINRTGARRKAARKGNSSSILKDAASQPRDRRGKPIADAQPVDDE